MLMQFVVVVAIYNEIYKKTFKEISLFLIEALNFP